MTIANDGQVEVADSAGERGILAGLARCEMAGANTGVIKCKHLFSGRAYGATV